jgi:hypothetical protein
MTRRLSILAIVLVLPLLGGCYQRVVSSRGLGGAEVQESYRSNTAADRAIDGMFGSSQKAFKGADNMPLQGRARWTSDMTGGGMTGTLPAPGSAQGATGGH